MEPKKEGKNEAVEHFSMVKDGIPPVPVWAPPKGRYGGELWTVFSHKMQRRFNLCYDLEYFHFILMDCDPLVRWICERPLRVEVKVDNKIITTTFDMWIYWSDGREVLREVKPQERVEDGSCSKQITAQKTWCGVAGIEHEVVTEVTLCRQPLLDNCRRMHPYLTQHPGVDWERKVLSFIDSKSPFPLSSLRAPTHLDTQKLLHAAVHLVCRGEVYAPLDDLPWDKLTIERHDAKRQRKPYC